jgi:hypothetical protein
MLWAAGVDRPIGDVLASGAAAGVFDALRACYT